MKAISELRLTMISLGQLKSVPSMQVASTSRTRYESKGCFGGLEGTTGLSKRAVVSIVRCTIVALAVLDTGTDETTVSGTGMGRGTVVASMFLSEETKRVE